MRTIFTALSSLPIGEVEGWNLDAPALLTTGELSELAGKPARTVAARLALKTAAIALFESFTGATYAAVDFEFRREDDGPTICTRVPALPPGRSVAASLLCSLSHTARNAYAVTAIEVEDGE